VAVQSVRFEGDRSARPAPGVVDALSVADVVVVCPSNPVVSIGPLLAVPGILEQLTLRRQRTVGVSPIIAGSALKGPADRLLREMGFESSVVGVARWYSSWVGTLVIDEADADLASAVEAEGVRCVVAPTVMSTLERSAALARTVIDAVG
jgi:LPPG:FO 2-phospho-L-lactate transferase